MSVNEIETQALSMGWIPPEDWKGSEEKFIDAETFVKRGKEFIPFLQASNRKLTERLNATEAELQTTKQLLTSSAEAIEELKNFRTALAKEKVVEKKEQIKTALKEARKEGDVDAEIELRDQLEETNAALKAVETPPPEKKVEKPPELTPEGKAWLKENDSWFGKDLVKTGLAQGLSLKWKNEGKVVGTKEYFDYIDTEMGKIFDPNAGRRERTAKVEGGSAGDSSRESGGSRSFADLPQDAKEACNRMAEKLVGKGKAYATKAEWQKAYVETYDWS